MFQSFDQTDEKAAIPGRLAALRARMADLGLDALIVPRADAHQGETVAPRDQRLAFATGFTGSAGTGLILAGRAALAVDGRYTIQGRAQTPEPEIEIVPIHETTAEAWLAAALTEAGITEGRVGYDPWLQTPAGVARYEKALGPAGASLVALEQNPVDATWDDQPPPPSGAARIHDPALAGKSGAAKRAEIAESLAEAGLDAAVLSVPASISWLLNIRGSDVARVPAVQAFAILHGDARLELIAEPDKFSGPVREHLGNDVAIRPPSEFGAALAALGGKKLRLDRDSIPAAVSAQLEAAGAEIKWGRDPCAMPKARKSEAELGGMRAAHRRDGIAMVRFLHWLDTAVAAREPLDEITVAERLEAFRRETGEAPLLDIAFDTISAAGPHAALPHYRVSRASNRRIDPEQPGEILLVDSGAQYPDGTTDITRTMAIGPVDPEIRRRATLVLKGMIGISRLRFPKGVGGAHLDAVARMALWRHGLDYDHGTGHGVGAHLDVHEGPISLSRRSPIPFEPGMILSNEPGYYREGHYGIRIENLVIVTEPSVPEGGDRALMGFETLTLAPIDRRLVETALLDAEERAWLDAYHARVLAELGPAIDSAAGAWLTEACAPL